MCAHTHALYTQTTAILRYALLLGPLYHVSLGSGYTIREQSRSLRWIDTMGTNRRWCAVYSNSQIFNCCANCIVSIQAGDGRERERERKREREGCV